MFEKEHKTHIADRHECCAAQEASWLGHEMWGALFSIRRDNLLWLLGLCTEFQANEAMASSEQLTNNATASKLMETRLVKSSVRKRMRKTLASTFGIDDNAQINNLTRSIIEKHSSLDDNSEMEENSHESKHIISSIRPKSRLTHKHSSQTGCISLETSSHTSEDPLKLCDTKMNSRWKISKRKVGKTNLRSCPKAMGQCLRFEKLAQTQTICSMQNLRQNELPELNSVVSQSLHKSSETADLPVPAGTISTNLEAEHTVTSSLTSIASHAAFVEPNRSVRFIINARICGLRFKVLRGVPSDPLELAAFLDATSKTNYLRQLVFAECKHCKQRIEPDSNELLYCSHCPGRPFDMTQEDAYYTDSGILFRYEWLLLDLCEPCVAKNAPVAANEINSDQSSIVCTAIAEDPVIHQLFGNLPALTLLLPRNESIMHRCQCTRGQLSLGYWLRLLSGLSGQNLTLMLHAQRCDAASAVELHIVSIRLHD